MSRHSTKPFSALRWWSGLAALATALVLSGYLMATGLDPSHPQWLKWFSLLPLFFAIRRLSPTRALFAGALWGMSLWIFASTSAFATISPTLPTFVLLTGISAAYSFLGARLTRWIGFSPFVLGVCWIGVELALTPLGLREGLLNPALPDGSVLSWMGQALGFVLVAFLVAYASAASLTVLSRVRISLGWPRRHGSAPKCERLHFLDACTNKLRYAIIPSRPRAPPVASH